MFSLPQLKLDETKWKIFPFNSPYPELVTPHKG
jgi:hypothetical protein